jgi:Ran GTPase-activating protein (RanGAP) involved in mRNA processing and transport
MQTITQLHLSSNRIGAEGAKHLAEVLRNNQVIHCTSLSISCMSSHAHMQTITQLDLSGNRIGTEGAKHLAEVLRNNQVIHCTSSSISCIRMHLFSCSYTDHYTTPSRFQRNR